MHPFERLFSVFALFIAVVFATLLFVPRAVFRFVACLAVLTFGLAMPAFADTVGTALQLQPVFSDLLQLTITVVTAVAIMLLPKIAAIRNNAALSNNLTKLLWDAAHFAIANDKPLAGMVGTVMVNDPIVATAASWLLTHADAEIKGLNLSDASVVSAVQAVIPQVTAAINGLTKGKVS